MHDFAGKGINYEFDIKRAGAPVCTAPLSRGAMSARVNESGIKLNTVPEMTVDAARGILKRMKG